VSSKVRILENWEEVETEVRRLDSVHLEYSLGRIRSSPNDNERSIHWLTIRNALLMKLIVPSKELGSQVRSRQLPPPTCPIEDLLDAAKKLSARTGRRNDWYVLRDSASGIRDFEEKHSCKVVYSELRTNVLHAIVNPIKTAECGTILLVWLESEMLDDKVRGEPSLVLDMSDSIRRVKLPAQARKLLNEIAEQIVCMENDGKFDELGLYYPKTNDSATILQTLYNSRL
jgi:hypothetical protein